MARLNIVDSDLATGETKQLLDAAQQQLGATPNFIRVLANSPSTLAGFVSLNSNLGRGKLDLQTRERIALAMAEANACQYCVSAHTVLADQAGLDEAEIQAARAGSSSDTKADAAVKFARSVLDSKGEVATGELQAVREAGFDDEEIVEIIAHVAVNTWSNFLGKVGRIDIDFPEVALLGQTHSGEQAVCAC